AYGRVRYWDDFTGNKAIIVIDLGGQVGASVFDDLNKIMPSRVVGIDFGRSATEPTKAFLKRSEMYLHAREAILEKKWGLPRDYVDLHKQLCAIEYDYRKDLQFWVKPKDLLKKELDGSPDDADAFVMLEEGFRHIESYKANENKVELYQVENKLDQPEWAQAASERDFVENLPEMGMYS
ncbi:MAG: hypothetical protein HKN39_05230, partial [Flavobacteriales bacterium]|nr:hypothetical protein [Flavobacteriales bacterium]